MITLSENVQHQLSIVGTGLIAEAMAGHVDVTGLRLLTLPDVIDHGDGSFTLSIAVPEGTPVEAPAVDEAVRAEWTEAWDYQAPDSDGDAEPASE